MQEQPADLPKDRPLKLQTWCCIDATVGAVHCIWPQVCCGCSRPSMTRMDKGCPSSHLLQLTNSSFSFAICMMCTNGSQGEALFLLLAGCHPCFGFEDAIVCVVCLCHNAHGQCPHFKGFLPLDCLFCGSFLLQVNTSKAGCLVNTDCCTPVPFLGQEASHLSD